MQAPWGGPPAQPGKGRATTEYDGPTLRAIRESMGVPLRRIARQAGMSHGHLSKVERGEHGRPVTPAVLAAYERVTGVRLADAAAALAEEKDVLTGRGGRSWRPGQLTEMRRQTYNAAIGAITVGGQLGEPFGRLLESTGRPVAPMPPAEDDLVQLTRVSELLTALDLQFGGGLVNQLARTVLRWAVPMLDTCDLDPELSRRLHEVVGGLASRAAWAAFDVAAHEAARSLFRLALYAAVRADDLDLRAHVLADVAAQHNYLGYHRDCLEVVRLGEGDERLSPAVRAVLHGVKARAYAALGEVTAARLHVRLAEEVAREARPDAPGWVGRLADPARVAAATGHALAVVAAHTGEDTDREEARQRLTQAVRELDPDRCARAVALAVAALASLHLGGGDLDAAADWARQAGAWQHRVRSARLRAALATIREAVGQSPHPRAHELVAELAPYLGAES